LIIGEWPAFHFENAAFCSVARGAIGVSVFAMTGLADIFGPSDWVFCSRREWRVRRRIADAGRYMIAASERFWRPGRE
jgi:hypothetical protein